MSFVLEVGDRRVRILGVTRNPSGEWLREQGRNVVIAVGQRAHGVRFLLGDRDTEVQGTLRRGEAGVRILRIPPRATEGQRLRRAVDQHPAPRVP